MHIGIIDADLLGREKHRFPNLVCEKISAYWKEQGEDVELITDYTICYMFIKTYDLVYVSKVFTDTPVPDWISDKNFRPNNVVIGGTGFYFDKAPDLPDEIEHHMPDYNLYDIWIENEVNKAKAEAEKAGKEFKRDKFMVQFKEYTDYSIGFLTRGCFRKCKFCVNQKYDHVFTHSPLSEFYDPGRKKICLLDDNFFGCPKWRDLLSELKETERAFKFKQGLDERLLTDERCKELFSSKYDGDFTFAFDNIEDYDLIESKLKMIRKYSTSKYIKFYVLVGFESTDAQDIENAFKRIELLLKYNCIPYVMRYQDKNETPWKDSEWRGMYITLARWANQTSVVKRMSFREFCERCQTYHKSPSSLCAAMKALTSFEEKEPEIAKKYFDLKFSF